MDQEQDDQLKLVTNEYQLHQKVFDFDNLVFQKFQLDHLIDFYNYLQYNMFHCL